MSKPLKGFITYSRKDERKRQRLRTCLAVMENTGDIKVKDDTDITAGGEARQEDILKEVANSDILLYLVSVDSLASENCNKELIEAVRAGRTIISIILESCDWLKHQLSGFEVLPHKGKPINKWKPQSDGWQNVVDGIRKAVEEMQAQVDASSETSEKERHAELAFQHGNALMMIRQIDAAIERYSYAIELDPDDVNTYNNRGVAYYSKGEVARAIADFNMMIRLDPNDALAYNNRGLAYMSKDDYDRAIGDYNMAIALNLDFAGAYNNRGLAYMSKDDYDRAIGDYNMAIALNPDYADAYYNRGIAYVKESNYECAIEDYTTAIQLKPDDAQYYNSRAFVYARIHEHQCASEDVTKAIELNPNYADAGYSRGKA